VDARLRPPQGSVGALKVGGWSRGARGMSLGWLGRPRRSPPPEPVKLEHACLIHVHTHYGDTSHECGVRGARCAVVCRTRSGYAGTTDEHGGAARVEALCAFSGAFALNRAWVYNSSK